jgi:uncharacterized phage infection (PIP) family protein YhgE
MKRIIALLAGVFVLQGCLDKVDTMVRAYDRDMEFKIKRAITKMQDGLRQFNHGQSMVITGVTLNKQVAVQQGLQDKMAPGNKLIQDGLNNMDQGSKLYTRGEKAWLDHEKKGPEARVGIDLMREGFKIAYGDGMRLVKQGLEMNNLVAHQEGATDKFSQNNQVIQTGMQSMEDGAKLFIQGENFYLKPYYFNWGSR